jgi:hypothetical protein
VTGLEVAENMGLGHELQLVVTPKDKGPKKKSFSFCSFIGLPVKMVVDAGM